MLNVKNCFNSQDKNILVYIFVNYWDSHLLKLWRWYSSTKNLKTQQQWDGNPCFMFTIIFVHKIIVMIDDAFECDTCLALCQHVNFKGLWLNGFSIGNVLKNFEASYFFHSCSDRSTFSFIVCGILRASRQYKKFSFAVLIMEIIMISFPKSQHERTIEYLKFKNWVGIDYCYKK